MLGPLATPLRTMLFAAGGAGLAWLSYNTHPAFPIVLVAVCWAVVLVTQWAANTMLRTQPVAALQLYEFRLLGIALVSAAAAAAVIIIAVELAAPKGADAATKEMITSATAALTAFITGVTVSAEDSDSSIGDFIRDRVRECYVAANADDIPADAVVVEPGTKAWKAVYTTFEYEWTDWTSSNRKARINALADALASGEGVTTLPARGSA